MRAARSAPPSGPAEHRRTGAHRCRRFGLARWSFSLTATDANRWAIRLARAVTDRPKILLTIGKAIGGGIPAGAYGLSAELADRLLARADLDLVDMGGVGGTLAGNALSVAATRATLSTS